MKLDYKTICDITFGAERVIEENGVYSFRRFTEMEETTYKTLKTETLSKKIAATANIRFSFLTDASAIKLIFKTKSSGSRCYCYFDLYENGLLINHTGDENSDGREHTIETKLSNGEKHLELYLPWSICAELLDFSLENASYVKPVKREKKMVIYGDSITQGNDAKFPSFSYANQISRFLNADSINKAIGGEVFFPQLLDAAENLAADTVLVAYGTNDWGKCTFDEFHQNCCEFMSKLSKIYMGSKIFVLTPIWRKDTESPMNRPHEEMDSYIREICSEYKNLTVIRGYDFVPHDSLFFYDEKLHPNDLGFFTYTNSLKEHLK